MIAYELKESEFSAIKTLAQCDFPKEDYEAILGVRQHQAILASYFLVHQSENFNPDFLVDKIYQDMMPKEYKKEDVKRLKGIADSILEIKQETHFEIDNLGINPIYLKRQYKEMLKEFFTRFRGVKFDG